VVADRGNIHHDASHNPWLAGLAVVVVGLSDELKGAAPIASQELLTRGELSLPRLARIRQCTELLEQPQHVGLIPLLGDPTVRHAADGDACNQNPLTGRGDPREWPRLRPGNREARRNPDRAA
jgi:hypothetical protein